MLFEFSLFVKCGVQVNTSDDKEGGGEGVGMFFYPSIGEYALDGILL